MCMTVTCGGGAEAAARAQGGCSGQPLRLLHHDELAECNQELILNSLNEAFTVSYSVLFCSFSNTSSWRILHILQVGIGC